MATEKTIEQWLKETLTPEEYADAENTHKQRPYKDTEWSVTTDNPAEALVFAFDWGKSHLGHIHYKRVFDKAKQTRKESRP